MSYGKREDGKSKQKGLPEREPGQVKAGGGGSAEDGPGAKRLKVYQ